MSEPTFAGSGEQQALAAQVFQVMTTQGRFFASDAPIRQTLSNLADFFALQRKADREHIAQEIDTALSENQALFAREERDGDVLYVTSRLGAYRPRIEDTKHMFRQRLYEPENPLPVDDISVVVTTTRPSLTTVEPVFISDYWQRQAGELPSEGESDEGDVALDEADEQLEEAVVAEEVPAEVVTPEPAAINLPGTLMTLTNGVQIDLRRPVADLMAQYGPTLVAQLRSALEGDPLRRIVSFGNDVYPEAQVATFGKNDLRRIREYIVEREEPLLDTQVIADVFYHNQRQTDYEAFRFALNYRLGREKDFEFVGVDGARLWSAKGMAPIGSKRVKASEMGQIAGYLEEGFDDSLKDQSADAIRKSGTLSHVLTFFEWEYGTLPFTRALAALVPAPLLPDQRSAVLRFDSPQHYSSLLAELRFPTGNRGGWISGFEEFFRQHLIPGALITLTRTDEPNIFTLAYEEQPETTDRLLVLDEKKNKFTFANMPFYCLVDTDMLLNQQQYGRLRNLKSLQMSERRKGADVLEEVFETIGDPIGTRTDPRYRSTLERLYVGMSVLRPSSQSYLQHLLRDGDDFAPEPAAENTWLYTPPPVVKGEETSDNDEDYDDDE